MKRLLSRLYCSINLKSPQTRRVYSVVGISGIAMIFYKQYYVPNIKEATCVTNLHKEEISLGSGSREERFLNFASMECNGIVLMNPADFLDSVTQQQPRYHKTRQTISVKDAEQIINRTPLKRYGSSKLFRSLDKEGLITYTEYLFLLCVLTKPQSGFKIAFNMFDTDLNEQVEKEEFLVLEHTLQHKKTAVDDKVHSETEPSKVSGSWFVFLNQLFSRQLNSIDSDNNTQQIPNGTLEQQDRPVQERVAPELNTTMLIHFFGKKGKDKLSFVDFSRFMENLQTEVLEIEFAEFSRGLKTISETDFARILLRCTTVDKDKYDTCIKRVVDNIQFEKGITFEDFKSFFQFLNNLEDFILAMKMYTLADRPISKAEFSQAVKACTNTSLSKQLVKTIFYMFDEDGDGNLSHYEFVSIMKNRLNRGFTTSSKNAGVWGRYRSCVSNDIYNNY